MEVLVFLGPVGSGKTTLARAVRRQFEGQKVAYIYNDEGRAIPGMDTGFGQAFDQAISFMNGCFSCQDVNQLGECLKQLKQDKEYNIVLIEPLGFVEGSELVGALKRFDVKPHVVSLLDVKNIELNHAIGTVPSQLREATLGVALTRCEEQTTLDDAALQPALRYIGEHASGKTLFILKKGSGLPKEVLAAFTAKPKLRLITAKAPTCGHGCNHDRGHNHKHDHHHHDHDHHTHGVNVMSYRLRDDVTSNQLERVLRDTTGIFRAKGVVEGHWFHLVHDQWENSEEKGGQSFLILYANSHANLHALDEITLPDTLESKDTRTALRDTNVPIDQTIALIRKTLAELPEQPLFDEDGPITHPEQHELLNNLRKRVGVPRELAEECIRARVKYFLSVTAVLVPTSKWWTTPTANERKLNLAIGIGWFAQHKAPELGREIMDHIEEERALLCLMLVEGFETYARLNSDTERAVAFIKELYDAMTFLGGDEPNFIDVSDRLQLLTLKDGRPELRKAIFASSDQESAKE